MESSRTCCRFPSNIIRVVLAVSPRRLQPKQTVPTGFSSVPPSGTGNPRDRNTEIRVAVLQGALRHGRGDLFADGPEAGQ